MAILNNNPLIGASGQSTGGYRIERSLRFNQADDTYLNRTPASAGTRTTWTWSAWIKRATISDFQYSVFGAGSGSPNYDEFRLTTADKFRFFIVSGGSVVLDLLTTQVFRDPSAWYHFVVAYDSTQATASNRCKLYVNGVQITALDTATYPSQNTSTTINNNVQHAIGLSLAAGFEYNGYQTDVHFIDGQQLTPSSFGETDTDTGVWKPKRYSGSYGTNGFKLTFSDNSNTTSATLGKDSSGNGNNWTPNNFSVTAGAGNDSLVDTPTPYGTDTGAGGQVRGNYCTLNPLNLGSNIALSNGNLYMATSGTNYTTAKSTMGVSSGKWYFEGTLIFGGYHAIGISSSSAVLNGYLGSTADSYGYFSHNGNKYNNGSNASYGASYTAGDIIGVALDLDAGTLVFYKNGVSQGTAYSGLSGTFLLGVTGDGSGSGSWSMNFGQRPFAYTAPSGFKALCTTNLPTPTIGATSSTRADDYFNTVLYTGNGGTQSVTGVGFQPDLVYIKERSSTGYPIMYDAVRGVQKYLWTNSTSAEGTGSGTGVTAFGSDGFTAVAGGSTEVNRNGITYVAWNWKANGAGSSNTAGTITSTVSANTTAGFSIVTFTTDGTTKTVGHGLGVKPSVYIVKSRNAAGSWLVITDVLGSMQYGALNGTGLFASIGYSAPTSTVFQYNDNNGNTQVAYCFAPIAGYSAFGSYTGNGSADGPFIYTGFRPAFILAKEVTGTAGQEWTIYDDVRSTYNAVNKMLSPTFSQAETTINTYDFLSNGFKLRSSDARENRNNSTYFYMAFAENPFKYSLAR